MDVLYFAYGSCMSPEDLGRNVSDFELIGPALVRGYRLGFTRYSRIRRGGVADLVPDISGVVEGVLYRVPAKQLAALDEREGAPDNYRRDFIAVRTPDGRIHDGVLTYVVADKAAEEIPPHPDYAATIMDGAAAMLSPQYVEKLCNHIERLMERKGGRSGDRRGAGERRSKRERSGEDDRVHAARPGKDRSGARRPGAERVRRRWKVVTYRLPRHGRDRAGRRAFAARRA